MNNDSHVSSTDLRYDSPIDLAEANHSHTQLYELLLADLKQASNVLEVGCATGHMGALLKKRGHHVTGIELNPVAAAEAKLRLDEVFEGGVEEFLAQRELRQFDAVLMGDVLEHLPDPETTLKSLASNVGPDTVLVLSVPNVAHGALRAALLNGHWEYSSLGLLDNTHLHFFTYRSILQTLQRAGWSAQTVGATYQNTLVVNQHYQLGASDLALSLVAALTHPDEIDVFQILVRARPTNPERLRVHEQWLAKGRVKNSPPVTASHRIRNIRSRIRLAVRVLCGFTLK